MDIIVKADINLIDFIASTANVLTFENQKFFYLGNQVIMHDLESGKHSVITEHEYSFLHAEVRRWLFENISQTLKSLLMG